MGSRKSSCHGRTRAMRIWSANAVLLPASRRETYVLPVALLRRAARWRSSTGAYVSGQKAAPRSRMRPVKTVRKMNTGCQRPVPMVRKPPVMGPSAGPRKGAEAKTLIARPRWLAEKVSAMTPPALVSGDEPKAPTRKRNATMAPMLGEAMHRPCHSVMKAYDTMSRLRRPKSSDNGAQKSGPIAKPSTKSEMPSVMTSDEPPSSRPISCVAPE